MQAERNLNVGNAVPGVPHITEPLACASRNAGDGVPYGWKSIAHRVCGALFPVHGK